MTANLPPGFDPGVWEGWRQSPTPSNRVAICRDLAGAPEPDRVSFAYSIPPLYPNSVIIRGIC